MHISEPTLALLDALPLECDGLTRVISNLLARDDVPHKVCFGQIVVLGRGPIHVHYWIDFGDGYLLDLRARMWLGSWEEVPHGYLKPTENQNYIAQAFFDPFEPNLYLFEFLTNKPLGSFPAIFKQ